MNEILVARKAVCGYLDQLRGLQIGHQERHLGIEHRCVQFTDRGLGARRTILYTKHNTVGM